MRALLFKTLFRGQNVDKCSAGACRWYYTNRHGIGKVTLYSKVSPLGDPATRLTPLLERWVEDGNKVRVPELQRIIRDLRKRKRFSQALEVSEWMENKGICAFSPTEHAIQLNLIGKVHGFLTAETYFQNLRDEDKTDKTYGALLHCYVRQHQIEKSLSHLQKMKEIGYATSPLPYNNIMSLYAKIYQYDKIPGLLTEMKRDKVSPDNFSYKFCIMAYGIKSDIEGMEKILKEMETQPNIVMDWSTYATVANYYIKGGLADKAIDAMKKSEMKLNNKDGTGHNHLISLYATLGKKVEVLRLWDLEKSACKRRINKDYINMLESLVRLGELEEAEKVLKEWETSGNCYDFQVPYTVIMGYCEKGLFEKAEAMLEELVEKGRTSTSDSWEKIAKGYLNKGNIDKAKVCMQVALSYEKNQTKGWKPNPKTVTSLLISLGETGSINDVEAFVGQLRDVILMDRQMYHALLKASIRSGKEVDGLLQGMKADKINEDEETKMILGLRE
ncbi:hypothetical protein NMG60_11012706 [Bertholletia excelsa]